MVCKGARDVPEVKGMCSRFFLFSTLVYSIQHSVDELFQNGMDYFSMVMCVIFFGGRQSFSSGEGATADTVGSKNPVGAARFFLQILTHLLAIRPKLTESML